ncbi:TlpA disulfide reductase family protein [Thalassovita sp.]|jgi:thiol-disulfide isomerase/thioredoxin|uniref:TlpA disulfide reductase family protein n=1 Tax=Thalassovita sp. TaxID=1979401 RepID=UPI0029DE7171|nr:TlpA disulfide reductase family protein [Thalassovita sp.]
MTALTRRGILAGAGALLLRPTAGWADAPSAAALARPTEPPRDGSALKITEADGTLRRLSDWAGAVVLLNFWGPWCVPCQKEMPSIARMAERVSGAGLVVLPLAFDWRGPNSVRRFYKDNGITGLPVLMGDGENLKQVLDTELLPSSMVIGRNGQSLSVIEGEATWDDDATVTWLLGLL